MPTAPAGKDVTTMTDIRPIILCGGVGSRLWPQSRSQSPKQFQPVAGPGSLSYFQATIQRHRGQGYGEPVVVTAREHAALVKRQLDALQCRAEIISEPVARNTGPAVLAAAMAIAKTTPRAPLLVLPSDHVISGDLNTPIQAMKSAAVAGQIVLFGIKPAYAETGYGYITDGGPVGGHPGLYSVGEFVEKPPLEKAIALIETGAAYWASGISLFTGETIMREMARFDRRTFDAVAAAGERAEYGTLGAILNAEAFANATAEPTERIVFERSDKVTLAPIDVAWSDVGCWSSVYAIGQKDGAGNVLQGDVISVDTENALVKSDQRLVAVVGLSDVIVVDTADALLVTARGRCQNVKKVVDALRQDERHEATRHLTRAHEWGESQQIAGTGDYDMSVLRLDPGASINVQPIPGRQIITVRGVIDLFDGVLRREVAPGDHLPLDPDRRAELTNSGSDTAEALLLTTFAAAAMQDARYA